MSGLTHFDAAGEAHMVDVGGKQRDAAHRRGARLDRDARRRRSR